MTTSPTLACALLLAMTGAAGAQCVATVEVNGDGVVTVEWENNGHGCILVVSGDGIAGYSTRGPHEFYSNILEFDLTKELPAEVSAALSEVARVDAPVARFLTCAKSGEVQP